MSREYIYIGAYGNGGISIYAWDDDVEKLELLGCAPHCQNPSFLALHPRLNVLYAVDEQPVCAAVTAYRIDPSGGMLEHINTVRLSGNGMCHISVLPGGNAIVAANYNSGNLVSCSLDSLGGLEKEVTIKETNEPRKRAHIHQTVITPEGDKIIAVDLGSDTITAYRTGVKGELSKIPKSTVRLGDGEGPRHMCFHPDGNFAYVLTELGNRVYLYRYSADSFEFIHAYDLLPSDTPEPSYAAGIVVSKDARFLYTSVRGYDHIVRFSIEKNGELSHRAAFLCHGKYPRMFAFSTSGKHVFIANQKSNSIVVMRVDEHTGDLLEPCGSADVYRPCAVLPVAVEALSDKEGFLK